MVKIKYIIFLCLLLSFFACENEPPYIRNPIFNIMVYQAGSGAGPSTMAFLSVHFILFDENGFDDITSVDLINTDENIVWKLKKNELEETIYGDSTYHGFSFYQYGDGDSVLLGNYIVRVNDAAGNQSDMALLVELEENDNNIYKPTIPEYQIELKDNKKEVIFDKMPFSSLEVKVLNQPELFNNSRKKFLSDEKIILSEKELPTGSLISFRVNSNIDERLIYFLKNYTVR